MARITVSDTVTGLAVPVNASDAATKAYVDSATSSKRASSDESSDVSSVESYSHVRARKQAKTPPYMESAPPVLMEDDNSDTEDEVEPPGKGNLKSSSAAG